MAASINTTATSTNGTIPSDMVADNLYIMINASAFKGTEFDPVPQVRLVPDFGCQF